MTTIEVPPTQLEQFEPIIREGLAKFIESGGQIIFRGYTFPDETYDNECMCRCPIAACTVFMHDDEKNALDFDELFVRTVDIKFTDVNLSAFVAGFDLQDPPVPNHIRAEEQAFYEFGKRLHTELRPANCEEMEKEDTDDEDEEDPEPLY